MLYHNANSLGVVFSRKQNALEGFQVISDQILGNSRRDLSLRDARQRRIEFRPGDGFAG